jgi:hypothetical protein
VPKIIYSNNGLKKGQDGICNYPFPFLFGIGKCEIIIRPERKDDIGLLNHELKHEEQYKNKWNHFFKYNFSKKYRFKCELQAYKEQIKEYKYISIIQCNWIIKALQNDYKLKFERQYIKEKVKDLL